MLNDHLGVDLWIELGLPDEKRIKKACSRAQAVALFAYNSRAAEIWWQQNQNKLAAYPKLTIGILMMPSWRSLALLPTAPDDAAGHCAVGGEHLVIRCSE